MRSMKKFIVLMAVALMATISNEVFAQTETVDSLTNPKALRDAERARQKAAQEIEESAAYAEAVKALEEKQFVLEADQVILLLGNPAIQEQEENKLDYIGASRAKLKLTVIQVHA